MSEMSSKVFAAVNLIARTGTSTDRSITSLGSYREGTPAIETSSNDNSPKIGQGVESQAGRTRAIFTAGVCLETKLTEISIHMFSVLFKVTERPSSEPAGSVTRIAGGEAERISEER